MNSKTYRWCGVPECTNTSIKTPNKLFVFVPYKETTRNVWLKLARRDTKEMLPTTQLYFCEDHFDLPNDMENYMEYHLMGSVAQIRMKPGCTPSKFHCQTDSRKCTSDTTLRNVKKQRKKLIEVNEKERNNSAKQIKLEEMDTLLDSSVDKKAIRGEKFINEVDIKKEIYNEEIVIKKEVVNDEIEITKEPMNEVIYIKQEVIDEEIEVKKEVTDEKVAKEQNLIEEIDIKKEVDDEVETEIQSQHWSNLYYYDIDNENSETRHRCKGPMFLKECTLCHLVIDELLKDHIQNFHLSGVFFNCPICNTGRRPDHNSYLKEIKKHRDHLSVNCEFCDQNFFGYLSMNQHVMSDHPDRVPKECNICGVQNLVTFPLVHKFCCHNGETIILNCDYCDFATLNFKLLQLHTEVKHTTNCNEEIIPPKKKEIKITPRKKFLNKCVFCDFRGVKHQFKEHMRIKHARNNS